MGANDNSVCLPPLDLVARTIGIAGDDCVLRGIGFMEGADAGIGEALWVSMTIEGSGGSTIGDFSSTGGFFSGVDFTEMVVV